MSTELSSDHASAYDDYWIKRGSSKHKYRFDVLLEWMKEGSSVLDVGCGDGYLGAYIAEQKKGRVAGVDLSSVAVERAKARGVDAVVGDLEGTLPFADKSFDSVIATEVIEHIIHSEHLLSEMVRISRGNVLVTIPNTGFWRYRLSLLLGRFPKQWAFYPYEHIRFWTIADFRDTARSLGLKILKIRAGSGRRWLRDLWPSLFAEQVCYLMQKNV